jgi:serine/threonine-protein kinase
MEAGPSDKTPPPFGRYVIRERIARGGMGEVFMAVAVGADGFEKPVVVKRLLPKFASRPEVGRLLSSEAKLMTRLVHPNIVQVIDFGRGESGDYFLVMELVVGTDLGRFRQSLADGGSMQVPLALYVATQVLRGLAHAHANASADGKRLVHRDISPGNVLVSTFGEVKIADFGVALVASSTETESRDSWFVGKPAYMAPEQLARESVDERADIYGVGAVLFEMLTGTPHRGEVRDASAAALADLSTEAADQLGRVASPDLTAIVLRSLAKRREDRFASAREMLRAIEQLTDKGQRIASTDDLASAVSEAVRSQPPGRPVIMLSAGSEGLAEGTELTRLEGPADEGFSVKIHGSSRPASPPSFSADAVAKRRAPRRSWLVFAVVGVTGALVALVARSRDGEKGPRVPAPAESAAAAPVESAAIAPAPVAALERPTGSGELAPSPPTELSVRSGHAVHARDPQPGCHGQVHLYANHGWILSGGPGAVQAPGRYDWPCGTYTLKAVSRLDARDARTVTVTVHESAPGVIDLR